MPVYEFYCADCHAIYNFYSRGVNTKRRPACPTCGRPELERKASTFAISRGLQKNLVPDLDESRLERALTSMAGELHGIDETNPRAAAGMMRKLFGASGLSLGAGMEEALRRMEAGEDPERVEAEMADVLEQEEPLAESSRKHLQELRRLLPPRTDQTWYPL